MAHVLVAAVPFAGHARPAAGVAAELVKRGLRVTAYTGERHRALFEAAGCRVVSWRRAQDFDESRLTETFPATGRPGVRGLVANVRDVFIGTAPGQVEDIRAIHAADPFDLIVADVMAVGPPIAAALLDVPWVTLGVLPLMLSSRHLPPPALAIPPGQGVLGRWRDAILRAGGDLAGAPLRRLLNRLRADYGLPPVRRFEDGLHSRLLTLNAGCELLDGARPDLPTWVRYIGRFDSAPATFPPPDERVRRLLAADAPLVLVTQGTFDTDPDDLLRPTVRALAGEPMAVIATISPTDLGFDSPANTVAVPTVAFAEVLDRVAVYITNGGWGGTLEALEHGVPLIVAGGDLDKPTIAMHVELAGVGINLRTGSPTEQAIRDATGRILAEPEFRARAEEVGRRLRELGGSGAGAAAIVALLQPMSG
ncbi:glycosyltransferase [Microbacterium gorillae]|uniref:glycosyltransferase n=1 Tax=Microbacterium gorillae TaxID=1231063 RepID=UPI00058F3075|nr:glycosyltransferase [Microbacterium gorillae]